MKKLIIYLFGLNDLRDLYISERRKQRSRDEQEFNLKYQSLEKKHERAMDLLNQEHDTEVRILCEKIRQHENREEDLNDREYEIKLAHKRVVTDSALISTKLTYIGKFFIKEASEIKRIEDESMSQKLLR